VPFTSLNSKLKGEGALFKGYFTDIIKVRRINLFLHYLKNVNATGRHRKTNILNIIVNLKNGHFEYK
jgi:hypothetical protein